MKNKYIIAAVAALTSLVSCDKFLDTMPDNRTEVDSAKKVAALLGSAYPERVYSMLTELMSDNMDNNRAVVTEDAKRLYQSIWNWKDNTETGIDSDEEFWENFWMSIAAANHALAAIEELGGPSASSSLAESYGEALLARAYCHFILVNIFCLQYNEETSATDQGLPYMDTPEQGLNPKYERGNVAEVYKRIDEDIQEGLKYVGDNYAVPKYHFNKQAAYAFATRFYLYYGQYEKAIQYANECLGPNPQGYLRDYAYLQANTSTISEARIAYNSSESKANFLMITGESNAGLLWGNYSGEYKHYGFTKYIAQTESFYAPTPWSNGALQTAASFIWRPREYTSSSLEYILFWKIDRRQIKAKNRLEFCAGFYILIDPEKRKERKRHCKNQHSHTDDKGNIQNRCRLFHSAEFDGIKYLIDYLKVIFRGIDRHNLDIILVIANDRVKAVNNIFISGGGVLLRIGDHHVGSAIDLFKASI